MLKTATEILQERAKMIHDARSILDKAQDENRDADAAERESFDKIMARSDEMKADADRLVALEGAEAGLEESAGRVSQIAVPADRAAESRVIELRKNVCGESRNIIVPTGPAAEQRLKDFRNFLISGIVPTGQSLVPEEGRAAPLNKTVDADGGYLSPPLEFMAELIKGIDDVTFMREICRVLPPLLEASTLGAPSVTTDMTDPTWTTEVLIGAEDTTFAFGRRELTPQALAKFIKVSKMLLRRSTMSADAIVRERLAYVFGTTEENAFLNGSGSGQPLGVFTASASGVPTSRDEDTDNTTTAFTYDGLINCQMLVKQQYRKNASWIMHRDAIKMVRKLQDGASQYIFVPSIIPGVPDALLSAPLRESEYAPNTFTAGLYVGIYGDFKQYWIVDALTMTIQVLVELYAATNQNGYLGRLEADGAPVDPNAFARVKLADS